MAIACIFGVWPTPAKAYIGAPPGTLGLMCNWSTHAIEVHVEKVDKEKGIIIWRKLKDLKGKWPGGDLIKENLAPAKAADREYILEWAKVGRKTVMFSFKEYHVSHTYIDKFWYWSITAENDWQWFKFHVHEPNPLQGYAGKAADLPALVADIYAGKEVVVPCMIGKVEDLLERKAKLQRRKASLKRLGKDADSDFVN